MKPKQKQAPDCKYCKSSAMPAASKQSIVQCHFKIKWIQLLRVYKTHTKYFLIGSNNAETKFKILKIDRTEPRELVLEQDPVEYSLHEVKEIIERLHAGNSGKTKLWQRGLIQTLTAFGIVGFVRFLEGYYMILITRRSTVAELGGHTIYKVEDTSMTYIPNSTVRISHTDESRYLKSFQTVDLSSHFYYSYSYDLSNSLQHNVSLQNALYNNSTLKNKDDLFFSDKLEGSSSGSTPESWKDIGSSDENHQSQDSCPSNKSHASQQSWVLDPHACPRYVWNNYLKEGICDTAKDNWLLDIIHGFIGQIKINIYGKPVYVTLIARRSSKYAGTRFLKRGCNIHGDVANEVETEQIVHSATLTSFLRGQYTAYVQYRGSIPVHWFQDITANMVPSKPQITIAMSNPYAQVTARHFVPLIKRFGSPIVVLNLVRIRERRSRESHLGEAFKGAIDYLNLFLPVKHAIVYQTLDMAHLSHSTNANVLAKLAKIAEENLQQTGIFQNNIHLFQSTLSKNPEWTKLKGEQVGNFRLQTGVIRSNCVDCLDRTNSAQFILAKCALAYQLYALGVLPEPVIEFDTDATRLFEELFEEHGDIIALQYGGSQLVHTIQSYRQTAVLASHSRDIVTTISRYYNNTFSDSYKQAAINLFLGIYKPKSDDDFPLWDLVTDNYLHNNHLDVLASFTASSYTMWLHTSFQSSLPLPSDFVMSVQNLSNMYNHKKEIKLLPVGDPRVDWFDEFYRTSELTTFDELFTLNMVDTMQGCLENGYSNVSPFASRADKWQEAKNQTKVSDSMSSQSSLDLSDSDDEDPVYEVRYKAHQVEENSFIKFPALDQPSVKSTYDPLAEYSPEYCYGINTSYAPSRRNLIVYRRYIAVEDIHNKFIPTSVFSQDSVYHVEPPTVDRQSRLIYEKAVQCCNEYPKTLLTNYKVYQDYVASMG